MKRIVRFSIILILVVCGILIAATAVLQFVTLDPYRERIAHLASEAIGRQVEINGHININLFPHPEVILNDIALANAAWGSDPTMVSVKHLDAAIGFLSIFSDTIMVRRIRLNGVSVLLEKNAQHIGNWVIGASDHALETERENSGRDASEFVHLPAMVDWAEFNNITLTVRSTHGDRQVYHISAFSLRPDASGNLIIESSGELLGNTMTLNGKITSKKSVSAHEAVNAGIQASLGDVDMAGQISTSRLATLADLKGTFNIGVKDIQKILKMFKIDAPLNGPLTADVSARSDGLGYKADVDAEVEGISVSVGGFYADKRVEIRSTLTPLHRIGELYGLKGLSNEALTLKGKAVRSDADNFDIDAFQVDVGQTRITATGRINTGGEGDLLLTLSSNDLSKILETLPSIDLKAKANVKNTPKIITVSELALTFDKSSIDGDITMQKGDRQKVAAHLTSRLLDLRPFSETSAPGTGQKRATSTGTPDKGSEVKGATRNQYVFKSDPIERSPLQSIEADAKIYIDHFLYDVIELKKVKIDAAVHGGAVDAKFKCDFANEGHAAGKIDLKTRGRQTTIGALVSVSDFRPKILQAEGVSQTEVPPVNISLELRSAGSSPRELASVANGRFLLTQGPGKIKNIVLGKVSSDIFSQLFNSLNPFAKHEEFSNWECTVCKVDLVEGLAKINGMLAQGEKVMIIGGGDIDLKTEKLNIEFNTKPRKGVGISADMFVTPFVKVKGTLASPSVGLNKKGTLLTGGAAVATGGLSLLFKGIFDRATAEGDKCQKAMEMAGQHTHYDF